MNVRTFRLGMGVCLLVSIGSGLIAAEWHVAPPPLGDDSNPGTTALPFATIQHGIGASSNGDTVTVAEGVYVENIQFNGKNIVLTGTNPFDPAVVASTVIDGNQAGSVVTFSGTETEACILSGFTIRNGKSSGDGGGICGGTYGVPTHAMIHYNTITGNSALAEWGGGGGVAFCEGTIWGNTITDNYAQVGGGLVGCDGTIQNNTIRGNWVTLGGGGLYGCFGTMRYNVISDNDAYGEGGGLCDCGGTIERNAITGNWAQMDGGGLWWCHATIQSNTIMDNFADLEGGGLHECDGMIQNNAIADNSAGEGGGLYLCDATIQNNTITGNRAYQGGGLADCNGTILNCIIWANVAPSDPQLRNSSIPTYSCIQGWTGDPNTENISTDPRFAGPAPWSFGLLPSSPCIDAGFNDPELPEFDFVWMHRILFGGKSPTVDMGAWEYYINTLSPGRGGDAILTWSSFPGKTYRVEYSRDMLTWQTAAEHVPSAGNTTTKWIDTNSPFLSPFVRRGYYRTAEE